MSDPYARIYLLPDKKQVTKRKTEVLKDNLNPKWDKKFDYNGMTLAEARAKTLYVNLKDEKGFLESQKTQFLGEVYFKLNSFGVFLMLAFFILL